MYGFIEFEREFDKIISQYDKAHLQKYGAVLNAVNGYIMEQVDDAVYSITLETAHAQADYILQSLDRNPAKQEIAAKTAAKDQYNRAKKKAIQVIKDSEEKQIKAIKSKPGLTVEERDSQIIVIQEQSAEKVRQISEKTTMPIEYYELTSNQDTLSKFNKCQTLICFDDVEMIMHFIKKDILQRPTLDERTLAMERYIGIANHLIATGKLDAAMPIIGALNSPEMMNRKTTINSLSPAAQTLLQRMNESNSSDVLYHLIKSGLNPQKIAYCKEKHTILPTTSICVTLDALTNTPLAKVSEQGDVTEGRQYDVLIENSHQVKATKFPKNEGIIQITTQMRKDGIEEKQPGYDLRGMAKHGPIEKSSMERIEETRATQRSRRKKEADVFISHVDETSESTVMSRVTIILTPQLKSTSNYKNQVPKAPDKEKSDDLDLDSCSMM
ncbi:MAG: RasGEF domain-containing protein [Legionella sp.]